MNRDIPPRRGLPRSRWGGAAGAGRPGRDGGGGGQRGRPRSQEADRAILTATVDLLA